MVHVSPGFGFPVLMCTGPCEESQLRGDGFVPSFDLNFPFGFSSLRALFFYLFVCLFLSPVGSVERKGSFPLVLLCPCGVRAELPGSGQPFPVLL